MSSTGFGFGASTPAAGTSAPFSLPAASSSSQTAGLPGAAVVHPTAEESAAFSQAANSIRHAIDHGSASLPESLSKLVQSALAAPYAKLSVTSQAASAATVANVVLSEDSDTARLQAQVVQQQRNDSVVVSNALLAMLVQSSVEVGNRVFDDLLAKIAPTCVTSAVAYIASSTEALILLPAQSPWQQASQPPRHHNHHQISSAVAAEQRSAAAMAPKSQPILLAAQVLFMITRTFQMTEQHVKEICAALDVLLDLVAAHPLSSSSYPGSSSFRQRDGDANSPFALLSATVYLCLMSLCNCITCWSTLRPSGSGNTPTSAAASNALLSSPTLAPSLEAWLQRAAQRLSGGNKFDDGASTSSSRHHHHHHAGGRAADGSSGAASGRGLHQQHQHQHHLYSPAIASGHAASLRRTGSLAPGPPTATPRSARLSAGSPSFGPSGAAGGGGAGAALGLLHMHSSRSRSAASLLAVVQLALAAVYIAKRDVDKGNDLVVTAVQGKAINRLYQLTPRSEGVLVVPYSCLIRVPTELCSYLLDEALAAFHHIAALDLRSYHFFLEQQREEELAALQSAQFARAGAMMNPTASASLPVAPSRATSTVNNMTHLFRLLALCMEHVPVADVLVPTDDGSNDTAISFFLLKNGVLHLRAVFELQRQQQGLWEPFALKLTAAFLEALRQLTRYDANVPRLLSLIAESQLDCTDLQLTSLMAQARECAALGTSLSATSLTSPIGGGAVSSSTGAALGSAATAAGTFSSGNPRAHNVQATREYAVKQQERFLCAFFDFLRTLHQRSSTGVPRTSPQSPAAATSSPIVPLTTALSFLQSNALSPFGLQHLLWWMASLVSTAADAELLWTALEDSGLLATSTAEYPVASALGVVAPVENGGLPSSSSGGGATGSVAVRSLFGHVSHELRLGVFPVTIGTLQLLYAIFAQLHSPVTSLSIHSVSAVLKFVAEDVASGVRARTYTFGEEKDVVTCLAFAVLSRGAALTFSVSPTMFSRSSPTSTMLSPASPLSLLSHQLSYATTHGGGAPPSQQQQQHSSAPPPLAFQQHQPGQPHLPAAAVPAEVVAAFSKAPNDVLGELLECVITLGNVSLEWGLSVSQCCVLRPCLELLERILCGQHEGRFPVEVRTSDNIPLIIALLKLIGTSEDPVVGQHAVCTLSLLPSCSLSAAARFLSVRPDLSNQLRHAFSLLLDPATVTVVELKSVDEVRLVQSRYDAITASANFCRRTKALFLEFVCKSASLPPPSFVSWLIGIDFFSAGRQQVLHPRQQKGSQLGAGAGGTDEINGSAASVALRALISGANDPDLAEHLPQLSGKYAKALLLLKSNRAICSVPSIARAMHERGAEEYLSDVVHLNLLKVALGINGEADAAAAAGGGQSASLLLDGGSTGDAAESVARLGTCLKTLAVECHQALCSRVASTEVNSGFSTASLRVLERLLVQRSELPINAAGAHGIAADTATAGAVLSSSARRSGGGASGGNWSLSALSTSGGAALLDDGGEDAGDDTGAAGSSSSAPAFCDWPRVLLKAQQLFPALPVPSGGLQSFIRVSPDSVPQYAIDELVRVYMASSASQGPAGFAESDNYGPEQTIARQQSLRQKLTPFVIANQCLKSYAAALQFIEGWALVLEIATTTAATAATSSPVSTAASGGPVNPHTTEELLTAGRHIHRDAQSNHRGDVSGVSCGNWEQFAAAVTIAMRIEDLLRALQAIMAATDLTGNLTVAAQEQIANVLCRASTAVMAQLKKVCDTQSTTSPTWNRADVQTTLAAVVNTLCTVGPRSADLRTELYYNLVLFLGLPGLSFDWLLLLRASTQLFQMLLQDVAESSSPSLQLAGIHCLRSLFTASPQLRDVFCCAQSSSSCAPTLSQFAATALRVADDHAVDIIARGGCDPAWTLYVLQGLFDILLLLSTSHAEAVFRSNAFSICNRMKVWTMGNRMTVESLSVVDPPHKPAGPQGGDGLPSQFVMGGAASSSFGGAANNGSGAIPSGGSGGDGSSSHAAARAVLQRLLVGTLRWHNANLRALGKIDSAVVAIAEWLNQAQLLLQLSAAPATIRQAMAVAAAAATTTSSSRNDYGSHPQHQHLHSAAPPPFFGHGSSHSIANDHSAWWSTLYEFSEALLLFSTTGLAAQCTSLVTTFAVPQVITELLPKDLISVCIGGCATSAADYGGGGGFGYDEGFVDSASGRRLQHAAAGPSARSMTSSAAATGAAMSRSASSPSHLLVAVVRTARNLLYFLCNVSYALSDQEVRHRHAENTNATSGSATSSTLRQQAAAPPALQGLADLASLAKIMRCAATCLSDSADCCPGRTDGAETAGVQSGDHHNRANNTRPSLPTAGGTVVTTARAALAASLHSVSLLLVSVLVGGSSSSSATTLPQVELLQAKASIADVCRLAQAAIAHVRSSTRTPGAESFMPLSSAVDANTTLGDLLGEFPSQSRLVSGAGGAYPNHLAIDEEQQLRRCESAVSAVLAATSSR